jgi:MFS family permease
MKGNEQPITRFGLSLRALAALGDREFRLVWLGQTISLVGDGAFLTALTWRAFSLVGSGRLGIILAAEASALLATLLIGGVVADRLSRRTILIACDLWRFGAVGALAIADATGNVTFHLLIVLVTLVGLADGLFYPASVAIVPLLVDQAHISSANSLIGAARWGSLMIGPVLAGALYGGAGASIVFAVDALSFLVAAALAFYVRPRPISFAGQRGMVTGFTEGIRYVARLPWLRLTIVLFAVVLLMQFAPQQVLLPELIADHFNRGVAAYGFLTSLFGVGMLGGALAFGQLQPRRRRGSLCYGLLLANSIALAGIALLPWYAPAAALALVRGACIGFAVGVWETILMELVPERLLARVVSFDFFGSFGLMPVGLVIASVLSHLAPPGTVIASGALASGALFLLALTRPWVRELD